MSLFPSIFGKTNFLLTYCTNSLEGPHTAGPHTVPHNPDGSENEQTFPMFANTISSEWVSEFVEFFKTSFKFIV